MSKVGYVILSYCNPQMTLDCIDFIKKLNHVCDYMIVVVDNKSPDNAGIIIKEKIGDDTNVFVYLHDENCGFAKGNNIGYEICRKKYLCDTIVVLNSDAFIEDILFEDKLIALCNTESNIAIIAPDIIEQGYKHKNPLSTDFDDDRHIGRYVKTIILDVLSNILLRLHINYFLIKKKNEKANYNLNVEQKDNEWVVPHGACVIYCPSWVNKENKAFYNGTFLYCEEHFLFAYAKKKNNLIAYRPTLRVNHLGDGSLNSSVDSERKRRMFVNKNQMKSFFLFLRKKRHIEKAWEE